MGGGPALLEVNSQEYERVVSSLLQVFSYEVNPVRDYRKLEKDYKEVDESLAAVESAQGEPHITRLVAKCAAHVEIVRELRKIAGNFKHVETMSWKLTDRCHMIANGFVNANSALLAGALIRGGPGIREALQRIAEQLQVSSVTIEGAACFHDAVVHGLTALRLRAEAVVEVPSQADAGFAAAPVFGGAALGVVALGLRALGPIGLLSSVVLVGAGAAGTSELAKYLHPAVKVRFMRLSAEIGRVVGRISKTASALHRIASEAAAESLRLSSLLEMECDGNEVKEVLISEGVSELVANLEACSKLCTACRYSRTPFLTVPSQF